MYTIVLYCRYEEYYKRSDRYYINEKVKYIYYIIVRINLGCMIVIYLV